MEVVDMGDYKVGEYPKGTVVGSPVHCGRLCALGGRLGRAWTWVRERLWVVGPVLLMLTVAATSVALGIGLVELARYSRELDRPSVDQNTVRTEPQLTLGDPVDLSPALGALGPEGADAAYLANGRVSFGAAGAMQPYTGTLSGGLDGWKIDRRGRVYDERGYFRGGDRASLLPQAHDGGWCPTTLRLYQQTLHAVDGEYCWRCSWWVDTLDGVWRFTRTDPMRLERVPYEGAPTRGAWVAARMEDEMRWVDGEWQVWRCR